MNPDSPPVVGNSTRRRNGLSTWLIFVGLVGGFTLQNTLDHSLTGEFRNQIGAAVAVLWLLVCCGAALLIQRHRHAESSVC